MFSNFRYIVSVPILIIYMLIMTLGNSEFHNEENGNQNKKLGNLIKLRMNPDYIIDKRDVPQERF